MTWWRRVNEVLKKEPETWLAYLYGQRFLDLKHLQDAEPRYKGATLRFLIFIYTLLRSTKLRFSPSVASTTYLIFAGTQNQLSALESTVLSLREKGQPVVIVIPKSLANKSTNKDNNYDVMSLGFLDFSRVLLLTASRLFSVLKSLEKISPDLIKKRFDTFLQPHISLIYFDRLLTYAKPKYVIVSNDHNTPNRSLLALARSRGCRTVYMQHASVSSVFPALNVDYAFLDGASAYDTYLQCEENHPPTSPRIASRQVILSGQKKPIFRRDKSLKSEVVGLAVNALDNHSDLKEFVKQVVEQGIKLKVRWHPGLSPSSINSLKSALAIYKVQYSDPHAENVNDFLTSIFALIAGNSSIHLESVLCGVPSFYYEITEAYRPDYYGYVKHGVAIAVENKQHLIQLLTEASKGLVKINVKSVRYFSATYGTEWEGREGELVASSLVAIDNGEEFPSCANKFKLK